MSMHRRRCRASDPILLNSRGGTHGPARCNTTPATPRDNSRSANHQPASTQAHIRHHHVNEHRRAHRQPGHPPRRRGAHPARQARHPRPARPRHDPEHPHHRRQALHRHRHARTRQMAVPRAAARTADHSRTPVRTAQRHRHPRQGRPQGRPHRPRRPGPRRRARRRPRHPPDHSSHLEDTRRWIRDCAANGTSLVKARSAERSPTCWIGGGGQGLQP